MYNNSKKLNKRFLPCLELLTDHNVGVIVKTDLVPFLCFVPTDVCINSLHLTAEKKTLSLKS